MLLQASLLPTSATKRRGVGSTSSSATSSWAAAFRRSRRLSRASIPSVHPSYSIVGLEDIGPHCATTLGALARQPC